MSDTTPPRFTHRPKADGTTDSICLVCLATISSQATETALAEHEAEHVCKFSFPARRSGRLPEGIERGRRQSDAEWEKHRNREA
jgi:hypothetical protein